MATKQDIAPRAQRLAALGAVAMLAAATAVAFGRVFVGDGTTWRLVLAGLASVALAAAFERRSLLLATVVSALALLVVVGLFVFAYTTWVGLPTGDTLRAAAGALARVGHDARVQVAPSQPLRPLVLAALTAVWTASFSAHALAVRAGSPLLAVLPPVALVGFADTVLEDGARPLYALLLLVAALLVVFTDGLRRIRQWGPVWSSPGRRRLSSVAGRGARRVGVTALAVALAFPGVLPGFRDEALVDFSTKGTATHLDPFVSMKAQLVDDEEIPLYEVTPRDDRGAVFGFSYWRTSALDVFDGENWDTSDADGLPGIPIEGQAALPQRDIPPDAAVTPVRQTIRLLQDQEDTALPLAYPAVRVLVPTALASYDQALGTVTVGSVLPAKSQYTVESRVVIPAPAQLNGVVPVAPNPRDVYLPESLRGPMRTIAQRWTAGAGSNPYRQILAIQDHFTSPSGPFHYSTNVDTTEDKNALLDFLTEAHKGFCQQFATAMAVLVRALGYPARVAVGYRTGDPTGSSFVVTNHDAHAWVEVHFPRYGWLPFEPTPTQPSPIAHIQGSYLNPYAAQHDPSDLEASGNQREGGTTDGTPGEPGGCGAVARKIAPRICTEINQTQEERLGGHIGSTGFRFERPGDGYGIPIRVALGTLLLLLLVLLVTVPAVKWIARLWIARRRAPPRETVLAAFRLFDGEAADVGLGRRPGETLSEYRRRLSDRIRFSDGHLGRLTGAVARAAYAPDEVHEEQARAALRDARVAIRDVRREAGLARRLLGIYRPGI